MNPEVDNLLTQAMRHHQEGDLARAEQLYRQILQFHPNEPNALHLLGMLLARQSEQRETARELIERAVALVPQAAEFRANLAGVYLALGREADAIASYRAALRLRPDFPEVYLFLGDILMRQGKWQEALASYESAQRLRPALLETLERLGHAFMRLGRVSEAVASYQDALRLEPEADLHYNLGVALHALRRYDESLASFEQAVRIQPDHAEALNNLGNAYKSQGRVEEAIACYRQAVAARPGLPGVQSNLLYTLHYPDTYDPERVFEEHRRWGEQRVASTPPLSLDRENARDPGRQLRIGYLTTGFCDNGWGRGIEAILRAHDPGQVEIFCYDSGTFTDALTNRVRQRADHWRSVAELTDTLAAEMIRQDRLDLLIDLAGHSAHNRLDILARKPAPIQATLFGYPDTTGLPTIDYRLTDPHCDPPGMTERFHTEKLFRLPEVQWCYVPALTVEIGPLPALQTGRVTFASVNHPTKVTATVIGLWARILQALPESQLIMVAGEGSAAMDHERRRFAAHGVAPERVRLVELQPLEKYFELYQEVDLVLDSYPCTAWFTSADALWMGVPVVSRAGPTAITRQGLALLSQVGLQDLVADTPESYIEIAVRLARDLTRLGVLRAELRTRLQGSPLMDACRLARNLEAAYRFLWMHHDR